MLASIKDFDGGEDPGEEPKPGDKFNFEKYDNAIKRLNIILRKSEGAQHSLDKMLSECEKNLGMKV